MQNPPAHAGNTLDKNATVTIAQDHPRLRGEYNHIKIDGQEYLGSPPLARGIHFLRKQSEPEIPITPACAGNTNRRAKESGLPKDHPRLRGEYYSTIGVAIVTAGSPPLTRGIPKGTAAQNRDYGITPAYAGNTPDSCPSRQRAWDHPRLRGEYSHPSGRVPAPPGSPPLTRGILLRTLHLVLIAGITPAYAGNTAISNSALCDTEDHPRLRGEYKPWKQSESWT